MSRRDDAGVPAAGGRTARPAGLLEKLIATIRPEFRSDDLVFDPRDPVFGGPPCAVSWCERPGRARGLCSGHHQRWAGTGKPDLAVFAAATRPGWFGHAPLRSCDVAGCRYGRSRRGLCGRHAQQWDYACAAGGEHVDHRRGAPAGALTGTAGLPDRLLRCLGRGQQPVLPHSPPPLEDPGTPAGLRVRPDVRTGHPGRG